MLDTRAESIIYYAQNYLVDLVAGDETSTEKVSLIAKRKFGKAKESEWELADHILSYLEAWEEIDKLDDKTEFNHVLECLINLCNLFDFPVAPTVTNITPPSILYGLPGADGADGPPGIQGETGLATDFQAALITVVTTVDSFDVGDANGARWDYTTIESGGAQRSGTVLATWNTDGSEIAYNDTSTADIVDSTEDLSFSVELIGSDICLRANPASGSWTVVGSRYFIPNNGNGSGPISDTLANGTIFIGNSSNVATSRTVSGVITITNTGVTAFTAGSIVNADINASAAIAVSKLAALTASRVLGTDGSGVISILDTATYPSLTELSYVKGVSSAIQTQLGTKVTDPTTTVGDLIFRNGVNAIARLGVGTAGQVLTMSGGLPTWATAGTGFADPMTTIGDLIRRDGSNNTNRLAVGTTGQVLTVVSGLPAWATLPTNGVTVVAATTYTILITDNIVSATNVAARTFTLPSGGAMTVGKIIWIKDKAGTAGTAPITVNRAGSDTFEDSSTSIQIIGDRSVQGVYWDGSNWCII